MPATTDETVPLPGAAAPAASPALPEDPEQELAPGTRVGRYVIRRLLSPA